MEEKIILIFNVKKPVLWFSSTGSEFLGFYTYMKVAGGQWMSLTA
jgi:hypothetical protein